MTCSTVTTPRNRPSASTAISAPSRRSASEPSSVSIGSSKRTRSSAPDGDVADRHRPALGERGVLNRGAVREPGVAAVSLDDGEPRPAVVAQEVVVPRLQRRQVGRDRDRLGVHDVGDRDPLQALGEVGLRDRGAR